MDSLCTPACLSSLSSWKSNVDSVCAEQTTIQGGAIVKARVLPLAFTYNADLVCMKDSEAKWCFPESQTWQGSDYIRWDPTMCFSNGNDDSLIAPECADPDFDIGAITDDMAALTNIYDRKLVCFLCISHPQMRRGLTA